MDWKTLPSLAALRAFEAAARCRNFSAAARELNVTHSAIAQHVRKLEVELSEPLILREGRGVAPTKVGAQLAQQLKAGFETIATGVSEVRDLNQHRPLNVAATPSFAANWLIPRMGVFWQAHPEISVNINPNSRLVDMRQEGFDLAIRFGDGNWPKLNSELLTHGDFWVVAHPSLLTGQNPFAPADLAQLPWLIEAQLLEWRRMIDDAGIALDPAKLTVLETNELVLSATHAALGVSVHPKSLVERDVASGALVKTYALKEEKRGYFMVTVPDRQSKALRVFQTWLRKTARAASSD